MEHFMLIVIALSCMAVVILAKASEKNSCANHAENDVCGYAGKTVKRCRPVDKKCAGDHCRLACVGDKKDKPHSEKSGKTKSSTTSDKEPTLAPALATTSEPIPAPTSTAAPTSAPALATTSEPIPAPTSTAAPTLAPALATTSEPNPAPTSTAAPTSAPEPATDCPNGFSDDFDVSREMMMFGWNLPINTVMGPQESVLSTLDECKAECIATKDCQSFNFASFPHDGPRCWHNNKTSLTKPSDLQPNEYSDYYERKCSSR